MTRGLERAKCIARIAAGYCYDFGRYIRHARGATSRTSGQRSYKATKIYHALEKSLSFRDRKSTSGWRDAQRLMTLLSEPGTPPGPQTEQERVALRVLQELLERASEDDPNVVELRGFLDSFPSEDIASEGGSVATTAAELAEGKLENPERFFKSRRSVRDYSPREVEPTLVSRAIDLASSSPSVCNRQAWHVYKITGREGIDKALSFQNGNRGFGHEISCLLVITVDLEAFEDGMERYQPWIDGGMFAMSVGLALHSLGLSTCYLNWSKGPRGDLAFRRAFPIVKKHSVITMMAVGYPNEKIKVCASVRRPAEDLLTNMS